MIQEEVQNEYDLLLEEIQEAMVSGNIEVVVKKTREIVFVKNRLNMIIENQRSR